MERAFSCAEDEREDQSFRIITFYPLKRLNPQPLRAPRPDQTKHLEGCKSVAATCLQQVPLHHSAIFLQTLLMFVGCLITQQA